VVLTAVCASYIRRVRQAKLGRIRFVTRITSSTLTLKTIALWTPGRDAGRSFYISKTEKQMAEEQDKTIYRVVMNHEEQYSIWPLHKENALGWKDAGKNGTKEACLAYIKEVWTDMRPLSLRKKMQEAGLS
jgi:MbtH protein